MFNSIDRKLKIISIIMLALGMFGSIGVAVAFWLNPSFFPRTWNVLYGLLILIGGFFISYATSLVIYGIGEAISNVTAIRNDTDVLKKKVCTIEERIVIMDNHIQGKNVWKCERCGMINTDSDTCNSCGNKLHNSKGF